MDAGIRGASDEIEDRVKKKKLLISRQQWNLNNWLAVSQIIEPDWVWAAAHRNNRTQDSATAV